MGHVGMGGLQDRTGMCRGVFDRQGWTVLLQRVAFVLFILPCQHRVSCLLRLR